jgi:antirestriction protein
MNTSTFAPSLYVGTYSKYNSGSIAGEWMTLTDFIDKDDFLAGCALLHADETDPEFMFQDFEGFPSSLYSESSCGAIFEFIEQVQSLDVEYEVIEAALELDIPFDEIEDAYEGDFESEESFAENWYEQAAWDEKIPDFIRNCMDFQRLWDSSLRFDYTFHNGFVFRTI